MISRASGNGEPRLSWDEHFWLFISHGSHLDCGFTNAVAAPVAFCAVQPFADTAFVASKNVGMDFPKRSHLLYSASFALVARAILDCGTCQIGKKTASKLEAKCNSLNRYMDSRFPNRSVASPCDQLRKLSRAGAAYPAASPHVRVVEALHRWSGEDGGIHGKCDR